MADNLVVMIFIDDVAKITDQSYRNARRLYKKIREHFNRPHRSFISMDDFCAYTGIPEEKVLLYLG